MCNYATNPIVNITTSFLIVLGGLGYIVWWDVIRVFGNRTSKNKHIFRHLTLHSKIAIVATGMLIVAGGLLFFIFEYYNPSTIANMSVFDKLQVSFFQSITTRTAGFASISQESLTSASSFTSLILMSIGGSPVGTAGGMKTVTLVVLICSAFATIRNKKDVALFGRSISQFSIRKAIAVYVMFMAICISSTLLLMYTQNGSMLDVIYETVSATATVGLSRGFTSRLDIFGKLVIIITMYLGRVGPISLAVALGSKKESQNLVSEPMEEISIG